MAARDNPFAKTLANEDVQSGTKAKAAAKRTESVNEAAGAQVHPLVINGKPMVEVAMAAAELIPTGQYANVSIGPAIIRTLIDPDDPEPFTQQQKDNIAKALNEIAEIAALDVIGVQRALTLQAMQEQLKGAQSN